MPETLLVDRVKTPIGELLLVADDDGRLCAADWHDFEHRLHQLMGRYHGDVALRAGTIPGAATRSVQAYFAGELAAIDRLQVRPAGTSFQGEVWSALRRIPCGQTTTYGELARRIGRPRAVRAVGHANGANPISVIVPCHRVIGASGSLTGYGGGLHRKQWLLAHEGVQR